MAFDKPPSKNELENNADNWAEEAGKKASGETSEPDSELVAYAVSIEEKYCEYIRALAYYDRITQREVIKQAIDVFRSKRDGAGIEEIVAKYRERKK
jgi:hypothetical protein